MGIQRIAVLGLGKVGCLAAELLAEAGFVVTGHDVREPAHDVAFPHHRTDLTDRSTLADVLSGVDAVLSCLPYHLNAALAEAAHDGGVHYFDLTEDVPTTEHIGRLAETAEGIMAPQCGLAPGFVGIVAASLTFQPKVAPSNCMSMMVPIGVPARISSWR